MGSVTRGEHNARSVHALGLLLKSTQFQAGLSGRLALLMLQSWALKAMPAKVFQCIPEINTAVDCFLSGSLLLDFLFFSPLHPPFNMHLFLPQGLLANFQDFFLSNLLRSELLILGY